MGLFTNHINIFFFGRDILQNGVNRPIRDAFHHTHNFNIRIWTFQKSLAFTTIKAEKMTIASAFLGEEIFYPSKANGKPYPALQSSLLKAA